MRELISSSMLIDRATTQDDEYSYEVTIEGYVDYHVDRHYGEDADGHRGSSQTFIDDIEDVVATNPDGEEVTLTTTEEENAKDFLAQVFLNRG